MSKKCQVGERKGDFPKENETPRTISSSKLVKKVANVDITRSKDTTKVEIRRLDGNTKAKQNDAKSSAIKFSPLPCNLGMHRKEEKSEGHHALSRPEFNSVNAVGNDIISTRKIIEKATKAVESENPDDTLVTISRKDSKVEAEACRKGLQKVNLGQTRMVFRNLESLDVDKSSIAESLARRTAGVSSKDSSRLSSNCNNNSTLNDWKPKIIDYSDIEDKQ